MTERQTAYDIVKKHGGRWTGRGGYIPTPGHSASDRGTFVRDRDDGRGVYVRCYNGNWKDVRDQLGIGENAPMSAQERRRAVFYAALAGLPARA